MLEMYHVCSRCIHYKNIYKLQLKFKGEYSFFPFLALIFFTGATKWKFGLYP